MRTLEMKYGTSMLQSSAECTMVHRVEIELNPGQPTHVIAGMHIPSFNFVLWGDPSLVGNPNPRLSSLYLGGIADQIHRSGITRKGGLSFNHQTNELVVPIYKSSDYCMSGRNTRYVLRCNYFSSGLSSWNRSGHDGNNPRLLTPVDISFGLEPQEMSVRFQVPAEITDPMARSEINNFFKATKQSIGAGVAQEMDTYTFLDISEQMLNHQQ